MKDPWENVGEKYKVGQVVKGTILKVNPFGLFVKLDDAIHGLAHLSQLNLAPGQKIADLYKPNDEVDFAIVSIEAKDHRLGLAFAKAGASSSSASGEENVKKSKKDESEVKDEKEEKAGESEEKKEKTEKTVKKEKGEKEAKEKKAVSKTKKK
jgi:ribosomal protein S1